MSISYPGGPDGRDTHRTEHLSEHINGEPGTAQQNGNGIANGRGNVRPPEEQPAIYRTGRRLAFPPVSRSDSHYAPVQGLAALPTISFDPPLPHMPNAYGAGAHATAAALGITVVQAHQLQRLLEVIALAIASSQPSDSPFDDDGDPHTLMALQRVHTDIYRNHEFTLETVLAVGDALPANSPYAPVVADIATRFAGNPAPAAQ